MKDTEAAKMLIVAWVKDWHLRNYARHITGNMNFGSDDDIANFSKLYKFMTDQVFLYIKSGKGVSMRRYVADYLPSINDLLWDRFGDTKKLLDVSEKIVKTKCINKVVHSKESAIVRKSRLEAKANTLSKIMYSEHREKCNAKGWNIVK